MPAKTTKQKLAVCGLSTHPMALQDFAGLLPAARFVFSSFAIEPRTVATLDRVSIPPAQVYLVDAQGPRAVTESILAALSRKLPSARLVVVGEKFTDATAFSALRVGARGLLTYAQAPKQLAHAVEAVAAGGFWVPRTQLSRFVDHVLGSASSRQAARPVNLSRREQEVLDALLENLANKEIASRLNISERTVKFHVSNVLAKFGVRRRADLIVHCFQSQTAPAS